MNKIDLFRQDNNIGDRVVICRNYGNDDVEGIVQEIGDNYVVLLKDNGRKARLFEDIISGWDTVESSEESLPEKVLDVVNSTDKNASVEEETSTTQILSQEIIASEEESDRIDDTQENSKADVVAFQEEPTIDADNKGQESDTSVENKPSEETNHLFSEVKEPKLTQVGFIDLSKCGDPRFRDFKPKKSEATKTEPTSEEKVHEQEHNGEPIDVKDEASKNASETTTGEILTVKKPWEFSDEEIKDLIEPQFESLNSTYSLDDDILISSLEDLALSQEGMENAIPSNARVVATNHSFCTIEKNDGTRLKCYYSRIPDYTLITQLIRFNHDQIESIPVFACTYIQKNADKEIVTSVCGTNSIEKSLDNVLRFIDAGQYTWAKLLFDSIKFCGVIQYKTLSLSNKQSWNAINKELKKVTFAQLDLPMISLDLKVSSDATEKSLFKLTEQKVKSFVAANNIPAAVETINKAVDDSSLSTKYVSSLLLRKAQLYSSIDDATNAISAYEELISYNESIGASKNNLSHLYTEVARLLLLIPGRKDDAISKLDIAIRLNPANKVAESLKDQASVNSPATNENEGERIVVDVEARSSVLRKMIDIDIQECRYSDKEILENNSISTPAIAQRLYEEATQSTNPEQFPKYLEAAKAYASLKVGSYNLQEYLYVVANYSRLKGNYLSNTIKKNLLSAQNQSGVIDQIRRLKDSAQSYYLETLDLWSSISEDSFDMADEDEADSKDEILNVVLEVLANYLKLDVAFYYVQNSIQTDYNSIFNSNFSEIFNQCIRSKNPDLEKIAYRIVIQIGSYSVQVWNKLSSIKSGTKTLYNKFIDVNSRRRIYDLINSMLGSEIDTNILPGPFLKKCFALHSESRKHFEANTSAIQTEVLGPHNIEAIIAKWDAMSPYWSLLSETETETQSKIGEVLSILKPYLSRKDTERTNLLIKAQSIIDSQIQFINENTTYYGRTFFFPLLNKWKKELKNILDERIALTNPVLEVKGDPMCVLLEDGDPVVNMIVSNTGDSSADGFEIDIKMESDSGSFETHISYPSQEIPAGDKFALKLNLADSQVTEGTSIRTKASISAYYLSNLLSALDYEFTIESEQGEFSLTEVDILWSDTKTPPEQLFVGREEILNRLVRHYSSIEKHEPYILYGLTRTGKSSILQYLADNINGKSFKLADGKVYNIIPIAIDFSTGASLGKASDFWGYVINDCVFTALDELGISYDYFHCSSENPRAKDFNLLLGDLKGIGLYPLFLIDEFSYIRTLIDKNIVNTAFLHTLRQYSLNGLASFIYAGTYDIKTLIKDPTYGFTGSLVTAHDEQIGEIRPEAAEELMDAMKEHLVITPDAKQRIHELSGDIPYFIQIICKNLGFFAVENKRKYIGYPELEHIVDILSGKKPQDKTSLVKVLPDNRFQNNQYSPLDPIEVSVLISSIVHKNRGLKIPRGVSYAELQDMWGSHGITDFRPKLASAIGLLIEKHVLTEYQDDGMQVYKLSVDLFRLWWENHHKDIERELSTIM